MRVVPSGCVRIPSLQSMVYERAETANEAIWASLVCYSFTRCVTFGHTQDLMLSYVDTISDDTAAQERWRDPELVLQVSRIDETSSSMTNKKCNCRSNGTQMRCVSQCEMSRNTDE
eukprot:6112965-Pyramimonas_sp.AAC.1